jgi:hypothetical protein
MILATSSSCRHINIHFNSLPIRGKLKPANFLLQHTKNIPVSAKSGK